MSHLQPSVESVNGFIINVHVQVVMHYWHHTAQAFSPHEGVYPSSYAAWQSTKGCFSLTPSFLKQIINLGKTNGRVMTLHFHNRYSSCHPAFLFSFYTSIKKLDFIFMFLSVTVAPFSFCMDCYNGNRRWVCRGIPYNTPFFGFHLAPLHRNIWLPDTVKGDHST